MSLSEASMEAGVSDLPTTVRRFFAAAIHFERTGKLDKAEKYLEKAVNAEAKT